MLANNTNFHFLCAKTQEVEIGEQTTINVILQNEDVGIDEYLDRTGTGADPSIYQDGYSQTRASQNNGWLFQIPNAEIDANPNISSAEQNPDS